MFEEFVCTYQFTVYTLEFKYYRHVAWCYFHRCSLLNWCVERGMPGTRVVLPAIRVTRGSIHQTFAKEKLKYIADVSYLIIIIDISVIVFFILDTNITWLPNISSSFYSVLWKKLWTKRIRIWNRNDLRGNNSQDCKHLVLSYQQS